MTDKIKIKLSGKTIEAELNRTNTAGNILDALPLKAIINRWGDEIYFKIPVQGELENSVEAVDKGTLAYWPPGNAFCIFFGLTPASIDSRPRAAGPVTIIGKISNTDDFSVLRSASSGEEIKITK